jgi:hypothetical protein
MPDFRRKKTKEKSLQNRCCTWKDYIEMDIEIWCLCEGVDLVQVAVRVFTIFRHWRPSWDDLIQNQAAVHVTSILMFSSNNAKLSQVCPRTFLNQNSAFIYHLSLEYLPYTCHPPLINRPANILRGVQIIKPLIMQFSPATRYFLLAHGFVYWRQTFLRRFFYY